ncbi:MAG: hypothetical protein LC792_02280, partial [Actinobacteria bacterium]|nr:hypothetical protein [Actinomycetota bacterium]
MTLTHVPITIPDDHAIEAESTLIIHRPRRRRRWPALVAGAVAVTVGAVGLWQAKSPALRFDGTPAVWRLAPGDETSMHRTGNALGSEVTVGFERAGAFSAELALVNHGRYPVKITGFPEKGAYYYGLESVEMASDADGQREAFRSFT